LLPFSIVTSIDAPICPTHHRVPGPARPRPSVEPIRDDLAGANDQVEVITLATEYRQVVERVAGDEQQISGGPGLDDAEILGTPEDFGVDDPCGTDGPSR